MSELPCCDLQLNPDITGIGVRVGLYCQILIGWATSWYWPDTFAKNARTGYMTAIALIIAAFIQLETQQLSLLDGIVVSLITTMMITFAIASSPPGSKAPQAEPHEEPTETDPDRSVARYITQFIFVAFWGAWCLNMWRDPAHFGADPQCTTNQAVTIMVFGREIHATDPRMRSAAISLISFGLVIAVGSLFFTLNSFLHPVLSLFDRTRTRDRPENEDPVLPYIRFFLQNMAFGTLIYLIVSTEQTIKKNDYTKATADWTYGQTIAVILLLQQIMDIASTYMEKKEEKKLENGKQDSDGGNSIQMTAIDTNRP
ncbi:hypothetical protein BDV93DRAFT_607007 [Ceratobasidium sp. AG-I]|nr:hypothetical protein BDV93DRAFT_607007 [Ceratobasidium sp. AG-I]